MDGDIVDKLLSPAISAGLAGLGAFFAAARGFVVKVKDLERRVDTELRDLQRRVKDLEDKTSTPVKVDTTLLKMELLAELTQLREDVERVEGDVEKLEDSVTKVKDSGTEFAKEAQLANYMAEVNARWLRIEQTIGKIEGLVEVLSRSLTLKR